MHRVLPVLRQAASTSSKQGVRVIRRRLATEASQAPKGTRTVVGRIFWTTTGAITVFYLGGTFASFHSQTYHDFFNRVPLGQFMVEYGEAHGWDSLNIDDVIEGGTNMVMTTYRFITNTINGTSRSSEPVKIGKAATESKSNEPTKPVTFKVIKQTTTKVEPEVKPTIREDVKAIVNKTEMVKDATDTVHEKYADLVGRAEAAIAGKPFIPAQEVSPANTAPDSAAEVPVPENKKKMSTTFLYLLDLNHRLDSLALLPNLSFLRPSRSPLSFLWLHPL